MTGPQEWRIGQFAWIDWHPAPDRPAVETSLARWVDDEAWVVLDMVWLARWVWPPDVTAVRPLKLVPADAVVLPDARLDELERHAAQARADAGLNAAARDILQRQINDAIDAAQAVVPDERREWLAHWLGQRFAASADQSPVPVPRDEPTKPALAPNRVRPSGVIIVGARMTDAVLDLVRDVEDGFADAVRAEAVAEERQRVRTQFDRLINERITTYTAKGWTDEAALLAGNSVTLLALLADAEDGTADELGLSLAADSVPVATPAEPLTLAGVFRAFADVHAQAGSKSPVRMFTDAAEAAERGSGGERTVTTGSGVDEQHVGGCSQWSGCMNRYCRCWCHVHSQASRRAPAGTGTPVEAVSGGSGHTERQHERDMRMADQQVASRDRVIAELRAAVMAGTAQLGSAWADVERLTAEIARYRAAIEAANNALDLAVAHAANHFGVSERSQRMVEQIARDVRAALEAGQGAQR